MQDTSTFNDIFISLIQERTSDEINKEMHFGERKIGDFNLKGSIHTTKKRGCYWITISLPGGMTKRVQVCT